MKTSIQNPTLMWLTPIPRPEMSLLCRYRILPNLALRKARAGSGVFSRSDTARGGTYPSSSVSVHSLLGRLYLLGRGMVLLDGGRNESGAAEDCEQDEKGER
jgi:hypothetical protein